MAHFKATMTSKGQITVPAGVRDLFDLKAGDIVDFYVDDLSRSVRIVARNKPVSDLFGSLNRYLDAAAAPMTQDEMDHAIGDHLAGEDRRIQAEWKERQEFEAWRKSRKAEAAE